MPRWESGSRERLADAALSLFATRGFEQTTVADIAAAAGLTERTFFRYYADKREVLFAGQGDFEGLFLAGLSTPAAGTTAPMTLVAAALDGAATFFPDEKRAWSRRRQTIIEANTALAEREQHKLLAVAAALADALTERGIEATAAALAAEAGLSVFRTSFAAWIRDGETRSFAAIQRETLHQLQALLATS